MAKKATKKVARRVDEAEASDDTVRLSELPADVLALIQSKRLEQQAIEGPAANMALFTAMTHPEHFKFCIVIVPDTDDARVEFCDTGRQLTSRLRELRNTGVAAFVTAGVPLPTTLLGGHLLTPVGAVQLADDATASATPDRSGWLGEVVVADPPSAETDLPPEDTDDAIPADA